MRYAKRILVVIASLAAGIVIGRSTMTSRPPLATASLDPDMARLVDTAREVHFEGVPLQDALAHLSRIYDVELDVRWQELENAGIASARTRPITFHSSSLNVFDVIRRLAPLDAGNSLDYRLDGQRLLVTTVHQAVPATTLRLHDVSHLFLLHPAGMSDPIVWMDGIRYTDAPWTDEEIAERLLSLLRRTAPPDSWKELGGVVGSLQLYNGYLIVEAQPDVQVRITRLLNELAQVQINRIQHHDAIIARIQQARVR